MADRLGRINSKRKGTKAERKCIDLLEATGYICTKAGGSLGLFDVIAVGPQDVKLIQVKCGSSRLSPLEREAIVERPVPAGVSKEYWLFLDRVKVPVIEYLGGRYGKGY